MTDIEIPLFVLLESALVATSVWFGWLLAQRQGRR